MIQTDAYIRLLNYRGEKTHLEDLKEHALSQIYMEENH